MADHVQQGSAIVSQPKPNLEPFAYTPLDHQKASLRLIRVLKATSEDGHIQCEIRHASIHDQYICLSYVWGEPGYEHTVLLDSRPFQVRSNLRDFLVRARQKDQLLNEWLWIDALCIDQTNVGERNHQVQQMGLIFSRAKRVLSWLGNDQTITGYLKALANYQHSPRSLLSTPDGYYHFINTKYWYRAWITQEVALARHVTLCATDVEVDFALLRSQFDFLPPAITTLLPRATRTLKGRSIIYLLNAFDFKDSCDRRDRVYSLLALCGDASDLQVDYNRSIKTIAQSTLRCCKQSFCLCSVRIVAFAMSLRGNHGVDGLPWHNPTSDYFAYITLDLVQGDSPLQSCPFAFSQPCNCEATTFAHTPGFVHQSPYKNEPVVVLYPRNLCGSYTKTRIEIMLGKANTDSTWNVIAWKQGAERTIESGRYPGCRLDDIDGAHCKAYFSFDFLVRIVHSMVRIKPCSRIVHQGTANLRRVLDSRLQLCQ